MKNRSKKIMALLLTGVMSAGLLAGCGGNSASNESQESAQEAAPAQEAGDAGAVEDEQAAEAAQTESADSGAASGEGIKIAFVPQLIGIPYFTAMEEGGNQAAADLGVEFLYTGATQASAAEQVKIMDSLIKQGVNALSLSVLDSSSTNPYIEKAQEAGIVVYTSDSDAPDSTRDFYVAQALDEDLGRTLMDHLAAQIDEEGQIGIVSGESTATNLNTWISFMEEQQKEKYTCPKCGGIISIHDRECSECREKMK